MLMHDQSLKEAFEQLESGKESLRSLASKLGVPKSTLHDWYVRWLEQKIEERRQTLKSLEHKVSSLQTQLNSLEGRYGLLEEEYRKKKADLESDYQKRKSALEGTLPVLKKEIEIIEADFKKQGVTLAEAVKIIKDVKDLQAEREALNSEIVRLKIEVADWQDKLNKTKSRLQFLEEDEKRLMAKLSAHYSQLDYFRRHLPKLEQREKQLQASVCALEETKARSEGEISKLKKELSVLKKEKAEAEASLKVEEARKAEIEEKIKELANSAGKIVEDAKENAKKIVESAEEERAKILREVDALKIEREKVRAEKELIEYGIKDLLKQLHQARESQKTISPTHAQKGSETPIKSLLKHLPTLPPLSTRQTRTQKISVNSN